jgi:hypothetical protein
VPTQLTLPGGGKLGVYQPRRPRFSRWARADGVALLHELAALKWEKKL